MKCVVTGGAGFIGSHLTDLLIANGHEVLVVDNLQCGNLRNLEHQRGKIDFLQLDINNLTKEHITGADWVFHLAGLADIVPSIENPTAYHHANVSGTLAVLEASRDAKKFIYAASSSCYGIPDNYPTPESAEIRPMYPYALTKYLGEQYVMHWGKTYGLPVVSLRFFNVFGPRSRTSGTYGAVFGVFLAQKIHGKPFTVVGDGTQTRDFTYVSDVAKACIKAAESNLQNEIFNVGSGASVSVNRLVELLGGDKVYIPKRPGEPDITFADIFKIKSLLGWNPVVSFEDGVRQLLNSIDYWKDAPLWDPKSIAEATRSWDKYLRKD